MSGTSVHEGALRYNQLSRGVAGITNITLTKCLRELEGSGLVRREELASAPPHVEHSLTPRGQSLVPILYRIHEWGRRVMEEEAGASKGSMGVSPAGPPLGQLPYNG